MNDAQRGLTPQEREARAKYVRDWRAKNREKVKVYNQRYWQKKAAQQNGGDADAKADA